MASSPPRPPPQQSSQLHYRVVGDFAKYVCYANNNNSYTCITYPTSSSVSQEVNICFWRHFYYNRQNGYGPANNNEKLQVKLCSQLPLISVSSTSTLNALHSLSLISQPLPFNRDSALFGFLGTVLVVASEMPRRTVNGI